MRSEGKELSGRYLTVVLDTYYRITDFRIEDGRLVGGRLPVPRVECEFKLCPMLCYEQEDSTSRLIIII